MIDSLYELDCLDQHVDIADKVIMEQNKKEES